MTKNIQFLRNNADLRILAMLKGGFDGSGNLMKRRNRTQRQKHDQCNRML